MFPYASLSGNGGDRKVTDDCPRNKKHKAPPGSTERGLVTNRVGAGPTLRFYLRDIHGLVGIHQVLDNARISQGRNITQRVILGRGNLAQNAAHDLA